MKLIELLNKANKEIANSLKKDGIYETQIGVRPPYDNKYDELATFNSDSDKSKYNKEYLIKMDNLQTEYNKEQIDWANKNGWLVL